MLIYKDPTFNHYTTAFSLHDNLIALAVIILLIASTILGFIVFSSHRKWRDMEMKTAREYYRLQMGRFVQQFDPHLIFNVISSLGVYIEIGKKEEANKYLLKFSDLMRRIITEEDYVRTLEEELDFIRDYCDMQKLIMEDKLEYDIQVSSPDILGIHIPRMMIHNFVENSIRWGIQPKAEGGMVSVIVENNDEYIITIRDNGVGRKTKKNVLRNGMGKGLEVTRGLIYVLNRNNKKKMRLSIKDLYDDQKQPCGTEVIITIPRDFNLLEETYKLK